MAEARAATYQVEPDFAARQTIVWAIAWLVGAASLTLALSMLLYFPDLGGVVPFLSYGRLRAVADTALWFGWLGTAAFAAVFAIVPRITNSQLHNEALGAATTLTWSVLLTAGIGTLLLGRSQGRPLGELPAGVDVGLALMLIVVLYNAGVTVVRRRERTLYVSGWYLLAAALSAPIVFVIGNLPLFEGATDMIVSGFYQSGLEMLWLLSVGLAVAHYVVPVETGNPLYSSGLARASFWSLVFAGGWTGQRFFVKGPGPDYLESIAIAMTAVLLVPVVSSAANLLATGRGRWHLLGRAFGLRFAVTGLVLSIAWIVLVVVSAQPRISRYAGLTSVHGAQRFLAGFGALTMLALALIYHAYPLMVGRDWYSRPLASFHYWGTLAAVVIGTATLLGSAAVQAGVLAAAGATGSADALLAGTGPQRILALSGIAAAALLTTAQVTFAYNTFRTSRAGPFVHVAAFAEQVGSRA